jgi:hypothetical protein
MGILSTASGALRGFLIAACATAIIMLIHLQHKWDDFGFTFAILMGIIWVGNLIVSSFVDAPDSGFWRKAAILIQSCILGIFTTLIMVLLFYGGELTPGVFMFFDWQFLVVLVSNCLIMIVATYLGYILVPDPEMEMAQWSNQQ